jgi:DNA polymerase-3 subunit epsilon
MLDEYSTLINPGNGEVGATFIHHITADAVADAPSFADVADQIMFRMRDAVMVAHHAAFEDKFLSAEFKRAGLKVAPVPALDTLWLARKNLDLPNFKQETLIHYYGIQADDAHTALGDVRALAQILPKLISLSDTLLYSDGPWAEISEPSTFVAKTRVSNLKKGNAGWMNSILTKLPDHALEVTSEVESTYLDYLALAFQDGKLIGDEAKELAKIAGRAGLGLKQVEFLNQRFLDSVIKQSESDGNVSNEEKKFIQQIKINLGLS